MNTPRYLIIGLFKIGADHSLMEERHGNLFVFGNSLDKQHRPGCQFSIGTNDSNLQLWITVDLIIGEHGEWTQRFEFLLRSFEGISGDLTAKERLRDPDPDRYKVLIS